MPKKPIVTICSSAAFYRQAVDLQEELEKLGFQVVLPISAERMKASGDFEVKKSWLTNANDYDKKAELIHAHLDKVAGGDATLVLNFEKSGQQNYIGGNVLMEMALAFHLRKPIFLFNDIPEESTFLEEIRGMQPIVMHGDIASLAKHYKLGSTASA